MIELAGRIPIRLSPGQSLLVGAIAAGLLLALLARELLETLLIGALSLCLRLVGHRPPRRSSFSTVLDEFERRAEHRDDQ